MATLSQLKYATTLAELGNFSRAAETCFVSQPSLSIQIQKLEDEIGYPLFDRATKPIKPTTKGQIYLEQARVVLAAHEKLNQIGQSARGEISGPFRLGLIPTVGPYLIPYFIEAFAKQYPKVELTIDEIKTDQALIELRNASLDAAILSTPLYEERITEDVLYAEPFYLYLSPSHPLAKATTIDQGDLDPSELWLLEDGHCFRNQVVNYCHIDRRGEVIANVKLEGGNLETLRYLIQKTRGYSLFPHLFIERLPRGEITKQVRDFKGAIPSREISLVYNQNQWKTDILLAIKGTILKSLPKEITSLKRDQLKVIDLINR